MQYLLMPVPLIVLAAVFLLIAVRQIGAFRLQIWHIMVAGALFVVLTGHIAPRQALRAINTDVLLFLFGMFVLGQAFEDSGYLEDLSYRFFRRAHSPGALVALILFGAGIASVFLMNDTLAIIGTPVVLVLARTNGVQAKLLLLALAFGVTIGSVTSPIGNPQNLLIAIDGNVDSSFVTFSRWLLLPTIVNLGIAWLLLNWRFQEHFPPEAPTRPRRPQADPQLARLARACLWLLLALVAVKVALVVAGREAALPLTAIAVVPAAPVLMFSARRWHILRRIDWATLAFFAAMFVLMQSVWQTGFFQKMIAGFKLDLGSSGMAMAISAVLSQCISNVPLVALMQPMMLHAGASTRNLMALAAGSTIAGNLTILGAASNVIIIQNAEKRADQTLTFFEFSRIGIPLGIINLAVYWVFLNFP